MMEKSWDTIEGKPLHATVGPRVVDIHGIAEGVRPFGDNAGRQADERHALEVWILTSMSRLRDGRQCDNHLWREPEV